MSTSKRKPFLLNQEPVNNSVAFNALGLITPEEDKITKVPIELIKTNPNNKYSVVRNQKMFELIDSVKKYGIMEPLILVRDNDEFRLVAGERRLYASKEAGLTEVPAIIKSLDDSEEDDYLVDTNNQREQSLSEKAWGYKIKYEAERRRKGERTDLTGEVGGSTLDKISADQEASKSQIARLIRITRLNEDFLSKVDSGDLPLHAAEHLSFIPLENQEILSEVLEKNEKKKISIDEAEELKVLSKDGSFTEETVSAILFPKKEQNTSDEETKRQKRIERFNKITKDCFPDGAEEFITYDRREYLITKLLKEWYDGQLKLKEGETSESTDQ